MTREMRRVAVAGFAYVMALSAIVAGGAVAFQDVYQAPAPEPGAVFAPTYRLFLALAGGILAVWLGALSGVAGIVAERWWFGLCGLAAGAGLTIVGLSVLPWIRFPHDQYAAGATWVFTWLPTCAVLWLAVTVLGNTVLPRRADFSSPR